MSNKLEYLRSASLSTLSTSKPTPAQDASAVSEAKVHITSSPSGGEIYVDGKFFGNTPSDITLPVTEHSIRVSLGSKEWTRFVQVTVGDIHIDADLSQSASHAATTAMADSSKESVTTEASTNSSQKPIGWIGVHAQNKGDVAVVTSVAADGPAAKAGVQVGDIILALDGSLIKGKDFETTIAALRPGTRISINYARGSTAHEVWLTVGSHNM